MKTVERPEQEYTPMEELENSNINGNKMLFFI